MSQQKATTRRRKKRFTLPLTLTVCVFFYYYFCNISAAVRRSWYIKYNAKRNWINQLCLELNLPETPDAGWVAGARFWRWFRWFHVARRVHSSWKSIWEDSNHNFDSDVMQKSSLIMSFMEICLQRKISVGLNSYSLFYLIFVCHFQWGQGEFYKLI